MKLYTNVISAMTLCAIVWLSSCQSSSTRVVHISGKISGLETGSLVSCIRPAASQDSAETVTTTVQDGGKFSLDVPVKAGRGDWYYIWIGATPQPRTQVSLYLDSGEVEIKGHDGGFERADYSGSKRTLEYQDFQKRVIDRKNSSPQDIINWIAAHPASAVGTALLDGFRSTGVLPTDSVITLFSRRSPAALDNLPAQRLKAWIKTTGNVALLKQAPLFSMPDTAGKLVSLKDFRGKYVLLDFWASWCGPCRAENPNVVKAYQQFKDKGFTVLGVSLDQPGAKSSWLAAIQHDGLNWTQVSDLNYFSSAAAKQYHIESIPANFLIDPKGNIIARNLRGEALQKKLAEVLPK